MELSPASPNVLYFVVYPDLSVFGLPSTPPSLRVSRENAVEIVARPSTIATADITDFDWVNETAEYTTPTPEFFPYGGPNTLFGGIGFFAAYSGGGTNTAYEPDGGVNGYLVEITTTTTDNLALFYPDVSGDVGSTGVLTSSSASSDGGQYLMISNISTPMLADNVSRVQVWRLPTDVWPPQPNEFWTGFVSAFEVL